MKGVFFFSLPKRHESLLLYLEQLSEPTTVQFAQRGARIREYETTLPISDGYCTVASMKETHGLGNPQIKSDVRCSSKQSSEVGPMKPREVSRLHAWNHGPSTTPPKQPKEGLKGFKGLSMAFSLDPEFLGGTIVDKWLKGP